MKGRYVVLEGGEGVGKSTQAARIIERLRANDIEAVYMQEPGSTPFAQELRKLIKYGPTRSAKANVLTFNAARAETVNEIAALLDAGKWVVSDRSFLSTLAYQGHGEGQPLEEVRAVCDFAIELARPDLIIVINLDEQEISERLQGRAGDYFEDMSSQFHDKVREGYLIEAARLNMPVVNGKGTEDEVESRIWDLIKPLIKDESVSDAPKGNADNNPYLQKVDGQYQITDQGIAYLEKVLTNTSDNVYVFNNELSPTTVAAAMARLSRRGDDMRITILDEFIMKEGKDEDLLKRVITAYGDDSVQQLTGLHFVVENASNLLTKKLEWGRLAAYLEQSTRYIYFDQKNKDGKYKYYTPTTLDGKTKDYFEKTMDKIFDNYSVMVRKLTDYVRDNSTVPEEERDMAFKGATRAQACDAIRPVLPVATTSTVGIYASGQAVENLIMHLLSDELQESKDTGQKILDEARKVIPTFLERADRPDRGGAMIAYKANTGGKMKQLAEEYLPQNSLDHEPVRLVDVSMRNELDLVPYMLYDKSALSLAELREEIDKWSYDKKEEVFQSYIGERLNRRHKPGRALEHIEYHWDLICDYGIFRDLQRHRMVEGLEWQQLSPRYGYDVFKLVEDAHMTDLFIECFDLSSELYSRLQALGLYNEAQYATLMGHKMRWKIAYNAREAFHLHELRTAPQGHPGYRKLVGEMHEKLCEVHPLLGSAMKFVNKDEDPELTRLAAERYTQFKLKQLDRKQN